LLFSAQAPYPRLPFPNTPQHHPVPSLSFISDTATSLKSKDHKKSPWQNISVKDEYVLSAVPPWFAAMLHSLRDTIISPATYVCPTSQNTRLMPLTAPSAIHLMICFLPDSQQRGLSVRALSPLSSLQRF